VRSIGRRSTPIARAMFLLSSSFSLSPDLRIPREALSAPAAVEISFSPSLIPPVSRVRRSSATLFLGGEAGQCEKSRNHPRDETLSFCSLDRKTVEATISFATRSSAFLTRDTSRIDALTLHRLTPISDAHDSMEAVIQSGGH
jgi:hypothetical protein